MEEAEAIKRKGNKSHYQFSLFSHSYCNNKIPENPTVVDSCNNMSIDIDDVDIKTFIDQGMKPSIVSH